MYLCNIPLSPSFPKKKKKVIACGLYNPLVPKDNTHRAESLIRVKKEKNKKLRLAPESTLPARTQESMSDLLDGWVVVYKGVTPLDLFSFLNKMGGGACFLDFFIFLLGGFIPFCL